MTFRQEITKSLDKEIEVGIFKIPFFGTQIYMTHENFTGDWEVIQYLYALLKFMPIAQNCLGGVCFAIATIAGRSTHFFPLRVSALCISTFRFHGGILLADVSRRALSSRLN